ncbi:hypothetical protein R1sor_007560 [Riccia sorocarpa]|uniref:BTB domain-containing protein n=1 Tax=Riccia sorocarpa TaxID=122646 RepID=A0ABD3HTD6_9MARC
MSHKKEEHRSREEKEGAAVGRGRIEKENRGPSKEDGAGTIKGREEEEDCDQSVKAESDAMVMDPESNSGSGDVPAPNFTFAFNDRNFSDRILRLEIVAGPPDSKTDVDGGAVGDNWARHKKRRRAERNGVEVLACAAMAEMTTTDRQEEQVMLGNLQDTDDAPHDVEEDADAMIEEHSPQAMQSSPVYENSESQAPWLPSTAPLVRAKTVHISSAILAAKSPFFFKLFSNGMRESEQREFTLRIMESEEVALMDLLQFMYSGEIQADKPSTVLDVLMLADKFEVSECMRCCSKRLRKMPMSPESALLYLELPSSVLLAEAVQPLSDAARQFLATRYKDIGRFTEEVLNLPIVGLEAVLGNDDLQVASEDAVFDFVIKWARTHYPKLEDRRDILAGRLVWLIRFPMMSSRKLRKVLTCTDFDHELASKLVLEALFFRAEAPHRQRQLALEETVHRRFSERAYKYRPVKVVEFDSPFQQCIVFLDLKLDECKALYPQQRLYSQAFHLGGQGFFLSAHCNMDHQASFRCFGLFLGMQEKGSVSFAVDYQFAARMKPSWEFVQKSKGSYLFTGGKAVGYRNLFEMPWQQFVSEDSPYFHEGILHLRAELTIKPAIKPNTTATQLNNGLGPNNTLRP